MGVSQGEGRSQELREKTTGTEQRNVPVVSQVAATQERTRRSQGGLSLSVLSRPVPCPGALLLLPGPPGQTTAAPQYLLLVSFTAYLTRAILGLANKNCE